MGQDDDEIQMIELRSRVTSVEVKPGQIGAWRPHYQPENKNQKLLDRSLNRKFDFFVLFVLSVDFILQGMDKTSARYAAESSSFAKHAHLSPNDISLSVTLFAVSYIALQPFSTAVARWFGCREWLSVLLAVWGVICMSHAAIRNPATFFVLRFTLGVAEAGFVPTAFYCLSTLYPKEFLGFRICIFIGFFTFSSTMSGLLANAVMKLDPDGIHNWQVLYLLEGGITVAMAFMSYWILPSSLSTAWMLTPDERLHAVHRMNEDIGEPQDYFDPKGLTMRDLTDALRDWRKHILTVCTIFVILPLWSFFNILPIILTAFGYKGINVTLMMIPPIMVGFIGLIIFASISDRIGDRSALLIFSEIIALCGLIVMLEAKSLRVRYAFAFVSIAGAFSGGPLIVAWLIDNTPLGGPRNLVLGINGWANVALLIARDFFSPPYRSQMYRYPLKIATILLTVSLCAIILIRISYMKVNGKRKDMTAEWTEQQTEEEKMSNTRRGNHKLTYIYGL